MKLISYISLENLRQKIYHLHSVAREPHKPHGAATSHGRGQQFTQSFWAIGNTGRKVYQ